MLIDISPTNYDIPYLITYCNSPNRQLNCSVCILNELIDTYCIACVGLCKRHAT